MWLYLLLFAKGDTFALMARGACSGHFFFFAPDSPSPRSFAKRCQGRAKGHWQWHPNGSWEGVKYRPPSLVRAVQTPAACTRLQMTGASSPASLVTLLSRGVRPVGNHGGTELFQTTLIRSHQPLNYVPSMAPNTRSAAQHSHGAQQLVRCPARPRPRRDLGPRRRAQRFRRDVAADEGVQGVS